ncbi:hypothetical protein BCON_0131g00290 [Botryotinia convoluta]|uniref:Uncharacterized protein n=1 Tax=Botryotinia convoluta TaxID=54673 RepID=A0A4Z1I2T0_9HELO|nr:hypothetical protein BCON_0131g00290 [Botryotinia convoluta]
MAGLEFIVVCREVSRISYEVMNLWRVSIKLKLSRFRCKKRSDPTTPKDETKEADERATDGTAIFEGPRAPTPIKNAQPQV